MLSHILSFITLFLVENLLITNSGSLSFLGQHQPIELYGPIQFGPKTMAHQEKQKSREFGVTGNQADRAVVAILCLLFCICGLYLNLFIIYLFIAYSILTCNESPLQVCTDKSSHHPHQSFSLSPQFSTILFLPNNREFSKSIIRHLNSGTVNYFSLLSFNSVSYSESYECCESDNQCDNNENGNC